MMTTRLAVLVSKFDGRCVYCGGLVQEGHADPAVRATRDHSVPKVRGGSSGDDNIVLACYLCNRLKSDMTAYEFRFFLLQGEFPKAYTLHLAKHRRDCIDRVHYARLHLKMLGKEKTVAA